MYAYANDLNIVGTKKQGALLIGNSGTEMQDMIVTGHGAPLIITNIYTAPGLISLYLSQ